MIQIEVYKHRLVGNLEDGFKDEETYKVGAKNITEELNETNREKVLLGVGRKFFANNRFQTTANKKTHMKPKGIELSAIRAGVAKVTYDSVVIGELHILEKEEKKKATAVAESKKAVKH